LPKNREQDYQSNGENSLAIPQVNSHGKKDSQSRTCKPDKGAYHGIVDERLDFWRNVAQWMYNAIAGEVELRREAAGYIGTWQG
jgi:hypothetical protein